MSRAYLNKEPHEVAAMFDAVAKKYDITNDVLSLGQTRNWRKAVVAAVAPTVGEEILDLAAGTGTSTQPFYEAGANPTACDFSAGMIEVGRSQFPHLTFVQGDAMNLPFADESFDAVTISFGLRNVQDPKTALAEMARVTKPGGRLVVCEFSHPTWSPFRTVYMEYLMKALPAVANKMSSNPDAYVYLAESIRAWPNQDELSKVILASGWKTCEYRDLTGGIVARISELIHKRTNAEFSRGFSALGLTSASERWPNRGTGKCVPTHFLLRSFGIWFCCLLCCCCFVYRTKKIQPRQSRCVRMWNSASSSPAWWRTLPSQVLHHCDALHYF